MFRNRRSKKREEEKCEQEKFYSQRMDVEDDRDALDAIFPPPLFVRARTELAPIPEPEPKLRLFMGHRAPIRADEDSHKMIIILEESEIEGNEPDAGFFQGYYSLDRLAEAQAEADAMVGDEGEEPLILRRAEPSINLLKGKRKRKRKRGW